MNLETIQNKIDLHDEQINLIHSKLEQNISLLKDIQQTLNNVSSQPAVLIPQYLPWVLTMLAYVIFGALLSDYAPTWLKTFLDFASSWFTVIALVVCGVVTANIFKDKRASFWTAVAYAGIFTNYLAYVLYNFSAHDAHIAAFGFNVATCQQAALLTYVLYLYRRMKKCQNQSSVD